MWTRCRTGQPPEVRSSRAPDSQRQAPPAAASSRIGFGLARCAEATHHLSVGVGRREGRPDAAGRADRAEQIGVVVALVGGLPWPRSAPSPLPDLAVLLADAGLVFKPDFNRRRLRQAVEMSLRAARGKFF